MSFLGLVVLVAALVPLCTRGSYRRLADAPWRFGGLLALGLGLQLFLDTPLIPKSSWHNVGFGILVASYVLLAGFCAGNVIIRGMTVVLIGVALNAFVVTIDQGMPVKIPADWLRDHANVAATVKHHPRVPGDHLLSLTDIIVLRRLDAIISFGDLIIAFGLVDVAFWASRRPRRSRSTAPLYGPFPTEVTVLFDQDAEPEPEPQPEPVLVGAAVGETGGLSIGPGPNPASAETERNDRPAAKRPHGARPSALRRAAARARREAANEHPESVETPEPAAPEPAAAPTPTSSEPASAPIEGAEPSAAPHETVAIQEALERLERS